MTRGRIGLCRGCGTARIAMRGVAYCFGCWPGGPVTPPPCLRCGSATDYFTSGLCVICHPQGIPGTGSCRDCQAWGAGSKDAWLCKGCKSWRRNYPSTGWCPSCGRSSHLGRFGSCRLCFRQALHDHVPGDPIDILGTNRHGQQLFFANTFQDQAIQGRTPRPPCPAPDFTPAQVPGQLRLFPVRHDLAAHGRAGLCERADPARFATLAPHLHDLAAANGWSTRRVKDTNIGLRIVLGIQDDPNAPIPASDVTLLQQIALPVWTVLAVLDRAGELIEDRIPALDRWYAQQIVGLPEPMTTELAVWFDLMHHGSASPPRRRPRSDTTIQLHVRWALPALRAWADDGHQSLREITVENLLDVLPAAGNARSTAGQGLRSIFRLLKAQKVVFIDPTRRIQIGTHESRIPMPADIRLIRDRLDDADPATAAVVALIAFHGLRPGHLRRLTITDARDGHLRVNGRVVPLAQPAQQRLSAYLTHRNSTWPNTANPHIFITRRTSHQDVPVSSRWIFLKIGPGLTASRIREDRILDETNATAGDVRVMTDLFGVSVQSLTRYTATLEDPQPGTRDPTHD